MKEKCVECNIRYIKIRTFKLCQRCASNPEIRDSTGLSKYWSVKAYGKPPSDPTSALPGSPEKLLVMSERAEGNYGLHHPLDARPDTYGDDLAAGKLLLNFVYIDSPQTPSEKKIEIAPDTLPVCSGES